jgi:hypothetical protein
MLTEGLERRARLCSVAGNVVRRRVGEELGDGVDAGLVSGPRARALGAERGHGTAREHGGSGAEEAGARKKKEKRKRGRRQVGPSSQRKREELGCCWAERGKERSGPREWGKRRRLRVGLLG